MADLQFVGLALGQLRDSFVYVVPSFRSEPLRHDSLTWVSEGMSSHWDYDVDDAMALVSVAFETTPEAKQGVYSIIGGSRGGGVALLAGTRDQRIERLVSFFGPTDFFDEWVREIVHEAALRMPRSLPGVEHLDSTVVQPFIRGEVSRGEARLELVRRSSVLYAAGLPAVQLHHGTIDQTVSVSQAESADRGDGGAGAGAAGFRGVYLRRWGTRFSVAAGGGAEGGGVYLAVVGGGRGEQFSDGRGQATTAGGCVPTRGTGREAGDPGRL